MLDDNTKYTQVLAEGCHFLQIHHTGHIKGRGDKTYFVVQAKVLYSTTLETGTLVCWMVPDTKHIQSLVHFVAGCLDVPAVALHKSRAIDMVCSDKLAGYTVHVDAFTVRSKTDYTFLSCEWYMGDPGADVGLEGAGQETTDDAQDDRQEDTQNL